MQNHCTLCPRACGANRKAGPGRCQAGALPVVARAAPHHWEEPCISGSRGSGTVFFAGCPLGCVFCQNHAISHTGCGQTLTTGELANVFLHLQETGVHNLNLVTAGHFLPAVLEALDLAKARGLHLPVVWNSSSYEKVATIDALADEVDVWLADLKFHSPSLSKALAAAPDYFAVASAALGRMAELAGPPAYAADGLLARGLIVRVLVLPSQRQDAKALLDWLAQRLPPGGFLLSLMRQYTPPPGLALTGPLARRLSTYEYNDVLDTALSLGLTEGFTQQGGSADAAFTPSFDGIGTLQAQEGQEPCP